MEIARRTAGVWFSPRLRMLTRFHPRVRRSEFCSLLHSRPSAAEPREQAYRQDAPQESEVHPRRRSAPVHVAGIPRNRDELQDREGDVAAGQWPDSEEVVLPVRMERREARSEEHTSELQSRQYLV